MRVVMIVLAIVQLLIAGYGAAIGGFADGGEWWDRLVIMVAQPAAAVGLVILVFVPRPPTALTGLIVALLAVNVAADGFLAYAISSGMTKGDWWLPLVFAVIPAIGLVYGVKRLSQPA